MKNNTIPYRVGELENFNKQVDGKVDTILTNHLPHIATDIATLKTEIRILAAINIGAVLITKFLL